MSLDAILGAARVSSAIALEPGTACEIDCRRLLQMSGTHAEIYRWMLHTLSKRLFHDEQQLCLLGSRMGSDARLASFLRRLSRAYHDQGCPANEFHLPMNRRDIGNYLGMTEESASRVFARFQKHGLIRTERKQVSILEPEKLRRLCREGGTL